MIRILSFLFVCVFSAARADIYPLPALFDVTGVVADDVLNIRLGPGSDFDVIGSFTPSQSGVEVVAVNDQATWAKVALPEGEGWVAFRYLMRQGGQDGITLPATLSCGGTEPFWGMSFPDNGAGGRNINYSDPENSAGVLATLTRFDIAAGAGWGPYLVEGQSADLETTAIISRHECYDGMSDRPYGFTVFVDMENAAGEAFFLHGCCSLSR